MSTDASPAVPKINRAETIAGFQEKFSDVLVNISSQKEGSEKIAALVTKLIPNCRAETTNAPFEYVFSDRGDFLVFLQMSEDRKNEAIQLEKVDLGDFFDKTTKPTPNDLYVVKFMTDDGEKEVRLMATRLDWNKNWTIGSVEKDLSKFAAKKKEIEKDSDISSN